jgi:hypothetical protein
MVALLKTWIVPNAIHLLNECLYRSIRFAAQIENALGFLQFSLHIPLGPCLLINKHTDQY